MYTPTAIRGMVEPRASPLHLDANESSRVFLSLEVENLDQRVDTCVGIR